LLLGVLPLRKPVRLLGVAMSGFESAGGRDGPQMMFAF
jgi:hypothetical protein